MKGLIRIIIISFITITPFNCYCQSETQSHTEPEEVVDLFNCLYSGNFYESKAILEDVIKKLNSTKPDLVDICITNYYWWQVVTSREYCQNRENMFAATLSIMNRHDGITAGDMEQDELFAIIHSYAFLTRLEMHEDRYLGGAAYLRKSLAYLEEVLPRAGENLEFTLLAGLYHYIMGSLIEKFPIFYPVFIFAPKSDKDYGHRLLKICAESGSPLISTEAMYFLARVLHEAHEDYKGADSYIKILLEKYPGNQYLRAYRITILADSGNISELQDEYLRLTAFNPAGLLSKDQNSYLIEETQKYLRKKGIKF